MTSPSRKTGNAPIWQAELLDLERTLLDPDARHSFQTLDRLLHPDYTEFGSSGRVYDKQTMISMMTREASAGVMIRDFNVRALSTEVALVTYRSIGQGGIEARRSSVWVYDDSGWQIMFHQGTRIPSRLAVGG